MWRKLISVFGPRADACAVLPPESVTKRSASRHADTIYHIEDSQEEGYGEHADCDTSQKTAGRSHTKVVEVSSAEERESSAQHGAEEVVAGQHRRDVARVAVGQVAVDSRRPGQSPVKRTGGVGHLLESSLEKKEDPHGHEGRPNDGYNPVNAGAARPSEPEHADGE